MKNKEERTFAKTLRIAEVLRNNGVVLSELQLTKKINGKRRPLLLSELEQEGVDIQKIIEDNGLNGTFEYGYNVLVIRPAYNGTSKRKITDEERKKAEELGIVGKKKKSLIQKTLEVARVLKANGVDLGKIQLTKKEDEETRFLLLSEIEQEGVDIPKIIEENGLDGNFKWGGNVRELRNAYKGTSRTDISQDEIEEAELLNLIRTKPSRQIKLKKESATAKLLRIAEVLWENGVDFSKIQFSRNIDGKQTYLLLSEIEQDGIDMQTIIEENRLDGNYRFGRNASKLRSDYNKNSRKITDEERKKAEKIGIVGTKDIRRESNRKRLEGVVLANRQVSERLAKAKELESMYKKQFEEKQNEGRTT